MSRPSIPSVASAHGVESWDTILQAIFAILTNGPYPIKEYADFASLPAAASYDRCFAATIQPPMLWISDGVAWRAVGTEVATTELTLAGTSTTWTGAFPAGVRQIGVGGRVTQLITASAGTTFDVGDHGASAPNRYANAIAFALGTTFEDVATADPGGWNAGARDVVVTCGGGGSFTAGKVRLHAHFIRCKAPVS